MNQEKLSIHLRGGFSDRNKIQIENNEIQLTAFDSRTRVALINTTSIIVDQCKNQLKELDFQLFFKQILADVYIIEVDFSRYTHCNTDIVFERLKDTIRAGSYDSVLTLIEYICLLIKKFKYVYMNPTVLYDKTFEKEYVGYRFVDSYIVPITDETELSEIRNTFLSGYEEVKAHLSKALGFLSDRTTPDYANSIKESITAVEKACNLLLGKQATLSDALDKLEKSGLKIHPALKSAFEKLYGYTSDESGIRHAGQLGSNTSTFSEAKFMVVACCAFINYLIAQGK